jgi:hypothetical protein
MGKNLSQIRPSKELMEIINFIKAKHLLEGRKAPSTSIICKRIAKQVNKEKLWQNAFIKF